MTAPGQEPNVNSNDAAAQAAQTSDDIIEPQHDIIPIWLIIGIFLVVMAMTWWMLAPNWRTDMARYRSIRAQQKGDYAEAIDQLKWLMERGAKENNEQTAHSPTYLSETGYSYLNLKDYENALKYYKLAQQYRSNMGSDDQGNPRPPADFQNMLGYVQLKLGDVDAATSSLQAALVYNKLDPLANFTLGEISMQKGNYIAAADYFKVVANNPTYEAQVKKYYGEIETKLFAGI